MRIGRVAVAAAVLVVFGAASASASASAPPGSAVPAGGPVGDALAISAGVEVRPGESGSYAAVAASQPVSVGDGVRTDATGFAEVAYADGSRTRLDVNTEFEVVGLTDDAGNAVTRAQMGLGRTWNRVESLGSTGGGFVVETSQATATVRGTAFLVSCLTPDSCDFSVMEGTVDVELADGTVIPVVGPATLDVTSGVASGPLPLPWDGLFGDPWLVANTDRDVDAGFADRATVYQSYGPAYASMVGTFDVTTAVSDVTCVASCGNTPEVGTDLSFSGEYSTQCEGGSCALVGQAGIPYAFDGVTYTINSPAANGFCFTDNDADNVYDEGEEILSPEWTNASDIFVAPSAAEVRDGAYLVTDFVWHRVTAQDPEGIPCDEPGGTFEGATLTDDGTGTRTG